MKIVILCSDRNHPILPYLRAWIDDSSKKYDLMLVHSIAEAMSADLLFLVSCTEIISRNDRDRFGRSLVIHASDLPKGRGWSPHIWTLLAGETKITISLIDAEEKVDTGAIWLQESIEIPRHALFDEICYEIFSCEIRLIEKFLTSSSSLSPKPQNEDVATYFPRRRPSDSEIDPKMTIEEAFDIIRVSDPKRYPVFFKMLGHRFTIELRRLPDEE